MSENPPRPKKIDEKQHDSAKGLAHLSFEPVPEMSKKEKAELDKLLSTSEETAVDARLRKAADAYVREFSEEGRRLEEKEAHEALYTQTAKRHAYEARRERRTRERMMEKVPAAMEKLREAAVARKAATEALAAQRAKREEIAALKKKAAHSMKRGERPKEVLAGLPTLERELAELERAASGVRPVATGEAPTQNPAAEQTPQETPLRAAPEVIALPDYSDESRRMGAFATDPTEEPETPREVRTALAHVIEETASSTGTYEAPENALAAAHDSSEAEFRWRSDLEPWTNKDPEAIAMVNPVLTKIAMGGRPFKNAQRIETARTPESATPVAESREDVHDAEFTDGYTAPTSPAAADVSERVEAPAEPSEEEAFELLTKNLKSLNAEYHDPSISSERKNSIRRELTELYEEFEARQVREKSVVEEPLREEPSLPPAQSVLERVHPTKPRVEKAKKKTNSKKRPWWSLVRKDPAAVATGVGIGGVLAALGLHTVLERVKDESRAPITSSVPKQERAKKDQSSTTQRRTGAPIIENKAAQAASPESAPPSVVLPARAKREREPASRVTPGERAAPAELQTPRAERARESENASIFYPTAKKNEYFMFPRSADRTVAPDATEKQAKAFVEEHPEAVVHVIAMIPGEANEFRTYEARRVNGAVVYRETAKGLSAEDAQAILDNSRAEARKPAERPSEREQGIRSDSGLEIDPTTPHLYAIPDAREPGGKALVVYGGGTASTDESYMSALQKFARAHPNRPIYFNPGVPTTDANGKSVPWIATAIYQGGQFSPSAIPESRFIGVELDPKAFTEQLG